MILGLLLLQLIVLPVVGFRWPRWWNALVPGALAGIVIVYSELHGDWRVTASGDNTGALAFFIVLVLTFIAELALFAGTLLRAASERRRGQLLGFRRAVGGAAGMAAVGFAVACVLAALVDPRSIGAAILLVGALAAAGWAIRLRRQRG